VSHQNQCAEQHSVGGDKPRVDWLNLNSTNNVDLTPIKRPKKTLTKIRKRFEVLVGDASFELATPAV
jgi:hypothetical protein